MQQLDGLHTKEYILENSLKISGEDRKMSDIDVICNWLKARKILTEVKHNRLIELCRYVVVCMDGVLLIVSISF